MISREMIHVNGSRVQRTREQVARMEEDDRKGKRKPMISEEEQREEIESIPVTITLPVDGGDTFPVSLLWTMH